MRIITLHNENGIMKIPNSANQIEPAKAKTKYDPGNGRKIYLGSLVLSEFATPVVTLATSRAQVSGFPLEYHTK